MKILDNLKTRTKLLGGFIFVALLIIIVALLGIQNLSSMNNQLADMYNDNLIPISQFGTINTAFTNIRGDIYRYLVVVDARETTLATFDDRKATIESTMAEFINQNLSAEEQVLVDKYNVAMDEFQVALEKYIVDVDQGNTEAALASLAVGGDILVARQNVTAVLDELTA